MKISFSDSIGLLLAFCTIMGGSALRIASLLPQLF